MKDTIRIWQAGALVAVAALIAFGCAKKEEAPAETAAETAAEPFRVAVVAPSSTDDLAFTQSLYDSLSQMQEKRGGEEDFQVAYSEGLYVIDDAAAAARDYATEGFDLVILHGSQYGSVIQEVAPDFPDTSFAWGTEVETFKDEGIDNIFAYNSHSYEGAYVEGVMAAMLTENDAVGIIGPIAAGDAKLFVEGFEKGVKETDPNVRVLKTYIGSFSDVSLAAGAANTHMDAGADVLTGHGQMVVGAVGVAKERGALWFGTQCDQTSLAPDLVVASQVYDWTIALDPIVELIQEGTRGGEAYVLDVANGGLRIVYNEQYDLPDDVRAKAEATIEGIINGTIDASIE